MSWLLIVVLVIGLLLIPLGMPGLWIMVGMIGIGAIAGKIGGTVVILTVAIALCAELVEFLLVKRLTKKYGGSQKAFWGAIAGGVIGVLVGIPVPIVGSIAAGLIGSFLGAAIVTFAETKELRAAHRVGFGAVVGRALSAVTKTAAGVAILALGIAALL